MSTYRVEWPCCGSVTETDSWEPESCPFCAPVDGSGVLKLKAANAELLEALRAMVMTWERGFNYSDAHNEIGNARAAIAKATGEQA